MSSPSHSFSGSTRPPILLDSACSAVFWGWSLRLTDLRAMLLVHTLLLVVFIPNCLHLSYCWRNLPSLTETPIWSWLRWSLLTVLTVSQWWEPPSSKIHVRTKGTLGKSILRIISHLNRLIGHLGNPLCPGPPASILFLRTQVGNGSPSDLLVFCLFSNVPLWWSPREKHGPTVVALLFSLHLFLLPKSTGPDFMEGRVMSRTL